MDTTPVQLSVAWKDVVVSESLTVGTEYLVSRAKGDTVYMAEGGAPTSDYGHIVDEAGTLFTVESGKGVHLRTPTTGTIIIISEA